MKINNCSYTAKNTTFGYNLPKYCDYNQRILTENFISKICPKKQAESPAAYEKYIQALKNFKEKRFDARPLHELYQPQMVKYGARTLKDYKNFIAELEPPIYDIMEPVTITRTAKVKEPIFTRVLNFLQGNPPKIEEITETIEQPVSYYDLSKINASVRGIEFARYGSFFTGDNPPHDYYEINLKVGKKLPYTLERFPDSGYGNNSKIADNRLQTILSDPKAIDEFGGQITKTLEDIFKSGCDFIIDMEKKVLELEQKWKRG